MLQAPGSRLPTLLPRLWTRIEVRLRGRRWGRPVLGAVRGGPRRALLVYQSLPFHLPEHHPLLRFHQRFAQARRIGQALGEAGYTVDAVDYYDAAFRPAQVYDLVLSHRLDPRGLEAAFGPQTLKVYLASGTSHAAFNRQLGARLDYFRQRHGVAAEGVQLLAEDTPFLALADALVGFGSDSVMATWRALFAGPCLGFDNYAYPWLEAPRRDWEACRNSFLFLGSANSWIKGLDLVLEAFEQRPHLRVAVCASVRRDPFFTRFYSRQLRRCPNIRTLGWMELDSPAFTRLAADAAFLVHPTCSEGSPGSVVNALRLGLVPVLTREAAVDPAGFGILLPDARLETLLATLDQAAALPTEELARRSRLATEAARRQFSEAAFDQRWREILTELADRFPPRRA